MILSIIMTIAAFLLTLLGTRVAILARRNRAAPLDIAALRKKQSAAPRGGGIVMAFAIVICLLIADVGYPLILCLLLLTAISLLHSIIAVAKPIRLLVQLLAVMIAMSAMPHGLFSTFLPQAADKTLTALVWLWFIHSFRVLDKADGLCASVTAAIGAGLVLVLAMAGQFPNIVSTIGLVTAGSGVGFLWWNWHPARIFMNDVGSIPVGFLLGYALLLTAGGGYLAASAILAAYVLCDSSITFIRKLYSKSAHGDHYYRRAMASGRSQGSIVRYVVGVHMLLMALAIYAIIAPEIAMLPVALAYFAVFMLLGFFAHTSHDAFRHTL
jgi:UDP-N-acetylmuramyl pentapeptide phosphotransferase/UDP-N-acetylglucosamine-1-phosphate transferase